MPDEITAQRVATIAAAARVPLDPSSPERIALGIAGAAKRFAAENIALPLEVEPSSFAAVARQDVDR
jgi:hypothetical protein